MKKLLIIQTAFIGDVILATGLIEKLGAFYPHLKIDFLLRKGNESLLQSHPKLNEVLIWDKKGGKYSNLYKTWRKIRKNNYDVVINLQRFLSSGLLSAFSGASRIVGFDKNPMALLFTERFPHEIHTTKQSPHEVERNHQLIRSLTDNKVANPKLYPVMKDFALVREDEAYVTISPTSVWFTKQWPAEKWIDLINRLPKDNKIFLLGAPSDKDACSHIANTSTHPNVEVKAGTLSLLQSAALMKGAMMNYVNDSAPLHLASSMNAPVTAVFLSTVPEFGFAPLSDNSKVCETAQDLPCRPCGLHGKSACPEGHFKCADIEVL
jgi:heptosyltransferase-2